MLDRDLQCVCCGRDFSDCGDDEDIYEGASCPSDDCVSQLIHKDFTKVAELMSSLLEKHKDGLQEGYSYALAEKDSESLGVIVDDMRVTDEAFELVRIFLS